MLPTFEGRQATVYLLSNYYRTAAVGISSFALAAMALANFSSGYEAGAYCASRRWRGNTSGRLRDRGGEGRWGGRGQGRAFTLIELMVVIAVVAILAALLFPVFAQAKMAAKIDACMGNLSQVGKGLALYLGDHDEAYPLALDGKDRLLYLWHPRESETEAFRRAMPLLPIVHEILAPYLRSAEVWRCPEDRGGRLAYTDLDFEPSGPSSPSAFAVRGASYAYRTQLGADSMRSPTGCRDSRGDEIGEGRVMAFADASPEWRSFKVGDAGARSTNVSYADTHVRRVGGLGENGFLNGWLFDCQTGPNGR